MSTQSANRIVTTLEVARRGRRLSQDALGRAIGQCQVYISLLERSVVLPSPELADQLAGVLGIPADQLMRPIDLSAMAKTEPVGEATT